MRQLSAALCCATAVRARGSGRGGAKGSERADEGRGEIFPKIHPGLRSWWKLPCGDPDSRFQIERLSCPVRELAGMYMYRNIVDAWALRLVPTCLLRLRQTGGTRQRRQRGR